MRLTSLQKSPLLIAAPILLMIGITGPIARAETWSATVGAQSSDKSRQALAFLPNEIWIHAGDSIVWTFDSDEGHTVTFLKSSQVRPAFTAGCPGFSGTAASFDGTACISTPQLASGQTFSVTFPTAGNYKLVCLVHADMTGVVHVLDGSEPLPHDQAFYDAEAARARRVLLVGVEGPEREQHRHHPNEVIAGAGSVVATGGGHHTISHMRFDHQRIVIHAGETVDWTNDDPTTPHTITFGVEPANTRIPSTNVSKDSDGALHATITSVTDSVHSGFIVSAPQERTGLPQAPLGATRFRVTFSAAGTYPYICSLHDELGMKGTVIVLP